MCRRQPEVDVEASMGSGDSDSEQSPDQTHHVDVAADTTDDPGAPTFITALRSSQEARNHAGTFSHDIHVLWEVVQIQLEKER